MSEEFKNNSENTEIDLSEEIQELNKLGTTIRSPEIDNNNSAEYIGNKTSTLYNSISIYLKEEKEKLKDKATGKFTLLVDGKEVTISNDYYPVSGYTDYHTYVNEYIVRVSVYDPKTSKTISGDISTWKEKWSSNFKKDHTYAGVKTFSEKTMTIKEACKYGDEFEGSETATSANYFLGLAEKVLSQCPNIINEKLHSGDPVETSGIDKLLSKPNMTEIDKKNMKKSVELLKSNKMLNQGNLKKLEAINYSTDHIEIGGVKRARINLKAEPDGKSIIRYGNEVYFKYLTLANQNKLLETKGMKIPEENDFVKSLAALPGYDGGDERVSHSSSVNILGTILNLSMSGSCNAYGKLSSTDDDGYSFREIRSITLAPDTNISSDKAYKYREEAAGGTVMAQHKGFALPIRPILIQR